MLITGSSSGIGAAAAVRLTSSGHRVIITGRSEAKLRATYSALVEVAPHGLAVPEPVRADLACLAEVRRLAGTVIEREKRLDVLVNNAGAQPRTRTMSADGHELALAVNHLAHQLLTVRLAGLLADNGGRVITTSSDEHAKGRIDFADIPLARGWDSMTAYRRSKLANILFTTELRRRTGLPASSFHPGSVSTDLNRDARFVRLIRPFERLLMRTPQQGASTLVWLATGDEGGRPTAPYYVDCAPAPAEGLATDEALAAGLWEVTAELTGS